MNNADVSKYIPLRHRNKKPIKYSNISSFLGHENVAELLIRNGAGVTVVGPNGIPAIIWSVVQGKNQFHTH